MLLLYVISLCYGTYSDRKCEMQPEAVGREKEYGDLFFEKLLGNGHGPAGVPFLYMVCAAALQDIAQGAHYFEYMFAFIDHDTFGDGCVRRICYLGASGQARLTKAV